VNDMEHVNDMEINFANKIIPMLLSIRHILVCMDTTICVRGFTSLDLCLHFSSKTWRGM